VPKRIRFVLPAAQMVIAFALTTTNRLRPPWGNRPAFLEADWQFCMGLNAPASLIWDQILRARGLWYEQHARLGIALETLAYLALVGVLWYLIAIEIQGRGRSALTSKVRLRGVVDLFATVGGAAVAAAGLYIRRHEFGFVTTYSTLVSIPYLVWGLVIASFYAHDLWLHCRDQRKPGAKPHQSEPRNRGKTASA